MRRGNRFAARHYELVATAMSEAMPGFNTEHSLETDRGRAWSRAVASLARMFEKDNTAFDKGRFVRRCQET